MPPHNNYLDTDNKERVAGGQPRPGQDTTYTGGVVSGLVVTRRPGIDPYHPYHIYQVTVVVQISKSHWDILFILIPQ